MATMAPEELRPDPSPADVRLVIAASSLGTPFEWYDFFIYGTLAVIIGKTFVPSDNETVRMVLVWAGFAVGFGFRPFGAALFGFLGDRLGRKYTFLVTITLMGIATAGVGLIPPATQIGLWAPGIIIFLRVLQGLALGGEYGGAAIYVAEHSPPGKSGFYTSFIQACVAGGFILSLAVVLLTKLVVSDVTWAAWAWRFPFLFSLVLLAVSLWMRLKLSESPIFQAMKEAGETAKNPFVESLTYPGNLKRLFVALFGVAAGLTVIWYTALFSTLSFLTTTMRVEETTAQLIVGFGGFCGLFWFILFGRISDRVGRKGPIVIGYALTLVMLFPIFWVIGGSANPALVHANKRAPVIVSGPNCDYSLTNMILSKKQENECAVLLDYFSKKGVAYTKGTTPAVVVLIGGEAVPDTSPAGLDAALTAAGYNLDKVRPTAWGVVAILIAMLVMSALAGATYGPVAALLTEMFPPRIRYSSMSVPYHIGTGYFGGFLPLISQLIVAKTGDPYAGLWYTWFVVLMALIVALWGLSWKTTKPYA
ncbi:MAG: MFS transporter [Sphingomonas sp.]|uniref:MFS transporter n=1 Tax=Sphingomonas sp. TaxID=28214 RepID=UPI001AD46B9C|nr:MFS transporter [Sphingomonas sp.]MBN8815501.1 MFS transporter [Sphingomonas sp.]